MNSLSTKGEPALMAAKTFGDAGASGRPFVSEQPVHRDLQARALDEILAGRPLSHIFATLTAAIEPQSGGESVAAALLADPVTRQLRPLVAPRMPAAFDQLVDGLQAESEVTAALVARRDAISIDLELAPGWKDLAQLPLSRGLRAGWWRGIFDAQGALLGAFGTYFTTQRGPTLPEQELLGLLAKTAALAIEHSHYGAQIQALALEGERRKRLADAVVANTPDLVYAFDLQHRFIYVNTALLTMWGRRWDESIGRTCLELGYEPWHAAMHEREIDTVAATKRPIRGEVAFNGTNGRRYYDYIFAPVLSANGEVEAVAGTTRDVTEQRQAAATGRFLADLTQRLSLMSDEQELVRTAVAALGAQLEAHRCYFVEFAPDGEIVTVGENWIRDTAASLAGTMRTFNFGGENLAKLAAAGPVTLADAHRDSRVDSPELVQRFDAMRIRAFAAQPVRHRLRQGVVLSVTDDRPRDWTEEELYLIETVASRVWPLVERARTEATLRGARDEALAGLRAKDAFLATLSHELRTPLNPVLLMASAAAGDDTLPPPVRANFATIAAHVSLEARLIDDLLDLTRITHDKLPLQLRREDLHALLRPVIAPMQAEAAAKGLTFLVALEAGEHEIIGDEVRLKQVFWNLLRNAVKFTPAPGRITVATRLPPEHPGRVEVRVSDTGIGISAEEAPQLFKAFSQGEHSRSSAGRFGGLGLGLAISRKLTEVHAGNLTVHSAGRDQGATFIVDLPLAQDASVAVAAASIPPPAEPGPGFRRILLVEDHEGSREALAHLLRNRKMEVAEAASVAEALQLAGAQSFDLLISDIGLPDGSGCELMASVKSLLGLPGIALSGYGASSDVAQSMEAGFGVHLTKPVEIHALDRAIAQLAGAKA